MAAAAGGAAAVGTTAGTFAVGTAAVSGGLGVAGAVGAGVGGFVGALAGQAAGNILGVQDGFSLKNALVSGLTAGATAGLGGALGAKAGVTLSSERLALQAAGGVVASAASNKLVGNPSGFRWANVAASAVSAFAGSALKIGGAPLSQGFASEANILSNTLGGVARAGIGYSVTKGIFNEGSWNFVDVAVDAFGNAIGNSIVSAGQPSAGEKALAASNALGDALGKAADQGAGNYAAALGEQRNANFNEGITGALGGFADSSIDFNNSYAGYELNYESDLRLGQGTLQAENFLTNKFNLETKANVLGDRTYNTLQGVKQLVNTPIQDRSSFIDGTNKGGFAVAQATANRSIGTNILDGVDVEAGIAFGGQRRDEFNDFYNDLNPVQKFAFDSGALLNETLIGEGKAIGGAVVIAAQAADILAKGGDIRIAASILYKPTGVEGKVFFGSDIHGVSVKSKLLEASVPNFNGSGKKTVAQRFTIDSLSNILEPSTYKSAFIQELDARPININATKRVGLNSEATFGTRINLTDGGARASLNVKSSLPFSIFGFVPSVTLEFRGK